jgi:DDE superfamily endonuclease
MRYEKINGLKDVEFRRLTGVKRTTFEKMIDILSSARLALKAKGGKPNKLSVEDSLLMTLEYLREYRTYFHISKGYGLSESACYRNIIWVEDTLVRDKTFSLPGRKALTKSDAHYEVVLVDATESPIERPKKKAKEILFWQEETPYSKNTGYYR